MMSIESIELPDRIAKRIANVSARDRGEPGCGMASRRSRQFTTELSYGRHGGPFAYNARPAAVVVLLYRQEDAWYVPLTLRPGHLQDHAGQVSLPGGAVEPAESTEMAARRELQEELGIKPDAIRLLGCLPEIYVFASNFLVTPYVAVCRQRPAMHPDPAEVAELLEVPLGHLIDDSQQTTQLVQRLGVRFEARGMLFGGHFIWGATAAILDNLFGLLD